MICTTPHKCCEPGADRWPTASSFISLRRALKCKPDRNRTAIGKLYWARARFRYRPVVAHASDWDAVWCKKAKSRSVRRIAISKDAWAIAMRSFISPRLLWSPQARWLDSFARRQISVNALSPPQSDALKKNQGRQERCRSWKVFRPMCEVAFSLWKNTI